MFKKRPTQGGSPGSDCPKSAEVFLLAPVRGRKKGWAKMVPLKRQGRGGALVYPGQPKPWRPGIAGPIEGCVSFAKNSFAGPLKFPSFPFFPV